jgi:hypothetical protein
MKGVVRDKGRISLAGMRRRPARKLLSNEKNLNQISRASWCINPELPGKS